jgi:hypothetical protein
VIKPIRTAQIGLVIAVCWWPHAAIAQILPAIQGTAVSRTAEGAVTVKATRIDGRLDERVYTDIAPIDEWFQQEPHERSPATERTEAWIMFDDRNIYISARCWDSHPEREVANEMRRDSNNIIQNESFTIIFDTFHEINRMLRF